MMHRKNLIDKFSTVYRVEPTMCLVSVQQLRRNLYRLLQNYSELNDEKALLTYFCESLKQGTFTTQLSSDDLAVSHLLAYADEACFYAARNAYRIFNRPDLTWIDYLQFARGKLIQGTKLNDGTIVPYVVKLCENYDPNLASFKVYAYCSLYNTILSEVRRGQEVQRTSDWGLLKRSSKKALKTALQHDGVSAPKFNHCVVACQGFQAVYAHVTPGGNRQLPPPTQEQFEAITAYFNERSPSPSNVGIEQLLSDCISALRRYYHTEFQSLDAVYGDTGNFNPLVAEVSENQFAEEFEQSHSYQYHRQLRAILRDELKQLEESAKLMLLLEYGLDKFPQQQIGNIFGIEQYTVSRRIKQYKRPLLKALIRWSQEQQEAKTPLTTKEVNRLCKQWSAPLDEWLRWYYRTFSSKLLQRYLIRRYSQDIPLLRYHFNSNGKELSLNQLAHQFQLNEVEVNEKVTSIQQGLEQYLLNSLETHFQFSHETRQAVRQPVTALVKAWLKDAPYAL